MSKNEKADVLEELEELGKAQMSIEDCSLIVGLSTDNLESGKYAMAYLKGRKRAQFEVMKAVYTMAKQGSSPAQKQFFEMSARTEIEIDENSE